MYLSGQISSRPKNPPNGGDCKGIPRQFQGNRVVGEILFHLARSIKRHQNSLHHNLFYILLQQTSLFTPMLFTPEALHQRAIKNQSFFAASGLLNTRNAKNYTTNSGFFRNQEPSLRQKHFTPKNWKLCVYPNSEVFARTRNPSMQQNAAKIQYARIENAIRRRPHFLDKLIQCSSFPISA